MKLIEVTDTSGNHHILNTRYIVHLTIYEDFIGLEYLGAPYLIHLDVKKTIVNHICKIAEDNGFWVFNHDIVNPTYIYQINMEDGGYTINTLDDILKIPGWVFSISKNTPDYEKLLKYIENSKSQGDIKCHLKN
jgi:hypothetical protein